MTMTRTAHLARWAGDRMRVVLRMNAAFSALTSAILLAFPRPLAEWLEIPTWLLVAIGGGVAVFAAYVAWAGSREPLVPAHVRFSAFADMAWVAGAAVVVLVPDALSAGGKVALVLVSLPVLDLGCLEWIGHRHTALASRV